MTQRQIDLLSLDKLLLESPAKVVARHQDDETCITLDTDIDALVCIGEYTGPLVSFPNRLKRKSSYSFLLDIGNRKSIDGEHCILRHIDFAIFQPDANCTFTMRADRLFLVSNRHISVGEVLLARQLDTKKRKLDVEWLTSAEDSFSALVSSTADMRQQILAVENENRSLKRQLELQRTSPEDGTRLEEIALQLSSLQQEFNAREPKSIRLSLPEPSQGRSATLSFSDQLSELQDGLCRMDSRVAKVDGRVIEQNNIWQARFDKQLGRAFTKISQHFGATDSMRQPDTYGPPQDSYQYSPTSPNHVQNVYQPTSPSYGPSYQIEESTCPAYSPTRHTISRYNTTLPSHSSPGRYSPTVPV